ncbi:30S ribosomal protein S14 [Pseudomonadota bacterium]|nr:30S ribosomal protein S14 [Pseudomonadota bacterium]
MAKKSAIQKNLNREIQVKKSKSRRDRLKAICKDRTTPIEERFEAQLKLSEMPRDGAKIRLRNRCLITGRPRGYYRKVKMSRIALRELALSGQIPGMVKSSW